MTNKQYVILARLKTTIESIGSSTFKYVGYYPFNIENIGNKYPAVLIQDGNESLADEQQNLSITKAYSISLWLYQQINQDRIETLLDRQTDIEDAIMDDAVLTALSNNADCILWTGIEKGDYQPTLDKYSVGYSDNLSIRKINIDVTFTVV